MKRAFSEHWRGVAAGLVMLALGLLTFDLMAGTEPWRADYVGEADELFANFPRIPASHPDTPPTVYLEPADIPAQKESELDLGNQRTEVVESPYGMGWEAPPDPPVMVFAMQLAVALVFVLPGVVAARIGSRVVAWRGALPGLMGAAFLSPIIASGDRFLDWLGIAVICILPALLAYFGGGVAKLLTWARTRAAA